MSAWPDAVPRSYLRDWLRDKHAEMAKLSGRLIQVSNGRTFDALQEAKRRMESTPMDMADAIRSVIDDFEKGRWR